MNQFLILLLISVLTFSGCNRGGDVSNDGKIRVGFVMKTLNNPFFIQMEEGATAAADTLNIELVVQAAEREIDVERQMQIIENLIQTRIDALCITPSGSREIAPAVKKANDAGISVIIVDTRLDQEIVNEIGASTVAFIGSDNYEGGKLAGEYYAKTFVDETPIAVLEGIPGHETHDSRLQGFLDAVENADQLTIVASQPANTEREQGFNVFQNILQTHPGVKALFATNDMMALGALEAIAQAGKQGEIAVIGFDAVDEARNAIRQGRMTGSIAQSPSEMGRIAVETAVNTRNGQAVESEIPVPITLITQENVD